MDWIEIDKGRPSESGRYITCIAGQHDYQWNYYNKENNNWSPYRLTHWLPKSAVPPLPELSEQE